MTRPDEAGFGIRRQQALLEFRPEFVHSPAGVAASMPIP